MERFDLESILNDSNFVMKDAFIKEPVLTMAFVNMQPITEIYSADDALKNGTLFKNIDKPFLGRNTLC